MPRQGLSGERGVILLMVVWLLILISVIVLSVAQEWRTEVILARNYFTARQASLLAEGGVYYAVGKLVEAQLAERQPRSPDLLPAAETDLWKGDGASHELRLPGGAVIVRVTDESGKININQASEEMIFSLLTTLGYDEGTTRAVVDAIMDWRDKDSISRPLGAESDYYLGLNPPYPAKNGPLDTVEELFWIRGLDTSRFSRLCEFFTVQRTGRGVNINAAPREVLLAVGFTPEQAQAVIQGRAYSPIRNRRELNNLIGVAGAGRFNAPITFRSSQFFEIIATGMVGYGSRKGRHTVKAVVRLNATRSLPFDFVYWADDYPG
uniref:General secretion pathway protein GspK n=1 Tax=Desulfobacca acetoxidans TaxID=60893 RepID=A0A7C3WHF6_9BACT